jgi:hypothetical protein
VVCAVSAVINSKIKPIEWHKMIPVAAVLGTLAFASMYALLNWVI